MTYLFFLHWNSQNEVFYTVAWLFTILTKHFILYTLTGTTSLKQWTTRSPKGSTLTMSPDLKIGTKFLTSSFSQCSKQTDSSIATEVRAAERKKQRKIGNGDLGKVATTIVKGKTYLTDQGRGNDGCKGHDTPCLFKKERIFISKFAVLESNGLIFYAEAPLTLVA